MTKYYIAYGSNLNIAQMSLRCPDATVLGTGVIKDYQLLFKGDEAGFFLTIEKKIGKSVPVAVWEINELHELALDAYEDYPSAYYKHEMEIDIRDVRTNEPYRKEAFVYIMHEEKALGMPTERYVRGCLEGYDAFGFDHRYLEEAINVSAKAVHKIEN